MRQAWIAAWLLAMSGAVQAEDSAPGVGIELNTLSDANGGCQITFVVTNTHAAPIDEAVYETVLFDTSGTVNRLTLFDFGTLPAERPRVRQFVIPDLACTDLGQVLINGVNSCEAPALGPSACDTGLTVKSRVNVDLIG